MILLARGLAQLLTFVLLVLLAAAGFLAAVGSLSGAAGTVSIPGFAELIGLPWVEDQAGSLLGSVEAGGPVAAMSLVGGAVAVLVGLVLLVGLLWPRRERLVVLDRSADGDVAGRRKTMRRLIAVLAYEADGVEAASARVRPRRRARPGGRCKVVVRSHRAKSDVRPAIAERIDPLVSAYGLKTRIKVKAVKE